MKANFNKLQEIDKSKNPFKVPENYFANFNEDIMNRLPEKEFKEPVKVTLWDKTKPWVYLAAMFIGMYVSINYLTKTVSNKNDASATVLANHTNNSDASNYWSSVYITEEEFYDYLEDQLIDDGFFDYMYDQYYFH